MSKNPVIWYELPSSDLNASKEFYEKLLSIEVQITPSAAASDASDILLGNLPGDHRFYGLYGALVKHPQLKESERGTLIYFEVPNIEQAADTVNNLGGKITKSVEDLGAFGKIAHAVDPFGQIFGLHQMSPDDQYADMQREANHACWFEIPVPDLAAATDFYQNILDCELGVPEEMKDFAQNEKFFPVEFSQYGSTGTLVKTPNFEPEINGATVYFSVDSIDDTIEKVKQHGGQVVFERTAIGEFGFIAQCFDIAGNRIGLHEDS